MVNKHNSTKTKDQSRGFTLIEILVVMGIASALLMAAFILIPKATQGSKNRARESDIAALQGLVNDYRQAYGQRKVPADWTDLTSAVTEFEFSHYDAGKGTGNNKAVEYGG